MCFYTDAPDGQLPWCLIGNMGASSYIQTLRPQCHNDTGNLQGRAFESWFSKGRETSKGKAHEKFMQRCQVTSMQPCCRSPLVWLEHFWQVSQAEQSSAGMWSTKDMERAQDMLIPLPFRLSRGGLPLSEDVQEWRTEISAWERADKISLLPSFKWLKFCHHLLSLMSFQYGLYDFLSSLEHKRRC